eukprot:PITA_03145
MDKIVEEYEDIFTSPAGVPLHCQVKHSIDLTPGAPLPNGPIYRRFVLENDEIKRQIQELLQKDQLKGAKYFSKIELKLGYHQVPIETSDVWNTAFKSKEGLFECQGPSHSGLASPTTLTELRSFLGLANFYRRFVLGFSHISWPLSQVTKGGAKAKFFWSEAQQKAFRELKDRLCTAPVLALPDLQQTFEVETDASDYAIGAALTQHGHQWHITVKHFQT